MFRIDLWEEAMAAHGLDIEWYVYRHRCEDEVLPWDHISPDCTRTSSGRSGPTPWPRSACPTVAGRRYDCGVHRLRDRARGRVGHPPAGGSQGTGQDLSTGGAVPVSSAPADGERLMEVRVRYAKIGKVRFLSHPRPARILERAVRRAGSPSPTARVLFGPGCTSARRCRLATSPSLNNTSRHRPGRARRGRHGLHRLAGRGGGRSAVPPAVIDHRPTSGSRPAPLRSRTR